MMLTQKGVFYRRYQNADVDSYDIIDGVLKGKDRLLRMFGPDVYPIAHRVVQKLAKILWREAGCPAGRDKQIWLKAEDQICSSGSGDTLLNARLIEAGYKPLPHPCGNCGICRHRAESYRREIDDYVTKRI